MHKVNLLISNRIFNLPTTLSTDFVDKVLKEAGLRKCYFSRTLHLFNGLFSVGFLDQNHNYPHFLAMCVKTIPTGCFTWKFSKKESLCHDETMNKSIAQGRLL